MIAKCFFSNLLCEAAKAKTCKAMKGLIEEGSEAIDLDAPDAFVRDAFS